MMKGALPVPESIEKHMENTALASLIHSGHQRLAGAARSSADKAASPRTLIGSQTHPGSELLSGKSDSSGFAEAGCQSGGSIGMIQPVLPLLACPE